MSRRELLKHSGIGLASLGLASMLDANNPMAPGKPHFAPKAKRVVHIFCNGGLPKWTPSIRNLHWTNTMGNRCL